MQKKENSQNSVDFPNSRKQLLCTRYKKSYATPIQKKITARS